MMLDLLPGGSAGAFLTTLVEEQVEGLLKTAVVKFRNGNLSPQDAMSLVAQIASLRSLPGALVARQKALQ